MAEKNKILAGSVAGGLLVLVLLGGALVWAWPEERAATDRAPSDERAPAFRPYEALDAPGLAQPRRSRQEAPQEPEPGADSGAATVATEVIVLEEGMIPEEEQGDEAEPSFQALPVAIPTVKGVELGPGAASRIKESMHLKVSPEKLHKIRVTAPIRGAVDEP